MSAEPDDRPQVRIERHGAVTIATFDKPDHWPHNTRTVVNDTGIPVVIKYGERVHLPDEADNFLLNITTPETPADVYQRQVDRIARRQRDAQHERDLAEAWSALLDIDEPVTAAICDLHRPQSPAKWSPHFECTGCDSYAESADWPCTTIRNLAQLHHITFPEDA